MNALTNTKLNKIAKMSKTQHAEMSMAYRAHLRNYSYSPTVATSSKKAAKALKSGGYIATASVGYGLQYTGLTSKGLRYCEYWFAAAIIAVL